MMNEIGSAVLAASRVGHDVGRQIQVDRVINEWVQYANSYKAQRDEAWEQIRSVKANLSKVQEELRALQAKLKSAETQVKSLRSHANAVERKNVSLSDEVLGLTKFKRDAQHAMRLHSEQCNARRKTEDGTRKQLVEKLDLQSRRLIATWARLTGAERVLGRFVSEVVERAPTLKLEMLDDVQRRSVLERAWNDVVRSKAQYDPSLRFTFEPIPI
ncbi:hypothetical protein ACXZ1M_06075 [Duganella sp. PWIR1]